MRENGVIGGPPSLSRKKEGSWPREAKRGKKEGGREKGMGTGGKNMCRGKKIPLIVGAALYHSLEV